MKSIARYLSVLALVPLLLLGLSGCGEDTSESKEYSDRVYVSDHLFILDEETSDVLPDGYICIGTVETLLSKNEPIETNNASNCLDVGSELYLPGGADFEDISSSIKLYSKNDADNEYKIFSMMFAVG